MSVANFL